MAWFDIFSRKKETTASVAKDRLQIIISRERHTLGGGGADYLPQLQRDLLEVIRRYEHVDLDQVTVQVDKRNEGEVLALNIILPEGEDGGEDRIRTAAACA